MRHIKLFEAFTFKTVKPTGKYRSFDDDDHLIKIKGFECGSIDDKKPHKISFMVWKNDEDRAKPADNKNCPWKWIRLKHESETLQAAKDWLNANFDGIMKAWDIRKTENRS